ncbi:MAG: hypothetical protein FJ271_15505 [Planctomycetes bacterium]|nr:hypothetical protein [Planctomycetota bacterium]
MGVTCPACGSFAQDAEFCDHCNADLSPPADAAPPTFCPLPGEDPVALTPEESRLLEAPELAVQIVGRLGSWRAHWLPGTVWERTRDAIMDRRTRSASALPPIQVVEEARGAWVLAEVRGVPARPWEATVPENPLDDLRDLCRFLKVLAGELESLHEQQLAWLTFDPREMEWIEGSDTPIGASLRFTNLDLEVYPARRLPPQLPALAVFAPPEVSRFQAQDIGPATDVYHLALFAYYWLAGLLPDGFTGNGLEAFSHAIPPLRNYRRDLPPGVAGAIARGLAFDPRHRFPSPGAFSDAMEKALRRNVQRAASRTPVAWEVGGHTRTGRAKLALDRDNEDHMLVRSFHQPERALLTVADGITTCEVGSGAIASLVTCLMLENEFDARTTAESFASRIGDLCRRGAENLLAWAIENGYRRQLEQGMDLMGTTLLAGWIEGNTLTLANVGDSRAYLIDGNTVEQLTVDGDLGNELLAARVPPEEVRSLGIMARGLRDCVGGCTVAADGSLAVLEDYFEPTLSRWTLLPGDVIVLCSDGLIEEGAYLEPEQMAEIIRSRAHLPAETLAMQLCDAADLVQRLPSLKEPEGFGDNITCIVVKINKA